MGLGLPMKMATLALLSQSLGTNGASTGELTSSRPNYDSISLLVTGEPYPSLWSSSSSSFSSFFSSFFSFSSSFFSFSSSFFSFSSPHKEPYAASPSVMRNSINTWQNSPTSSSSSCLVSIESSPMVIHHDHHL